MTMPDTTPIPNETAKTLSQKSNTRRYTGLPVAKDMPSIVASQAASPIVNAGKMMWNVMTNANWIRDSKTTSRSIDFPPWPKAAYPYWQPSQSLVTGSPSAPSRPRMTTLAVTIFVGQARFVKPAATATFCAPFAV